MHERISLNIGTSLTAVFHYLAPFLGLKTQLANLVFAGPASGSAADPTFRSLAVADIPFAIKTGNTTHDISATGTQAITVGFQPTMVLIFQALASNRASVGLDDGTRQFCIYFPNLTDTSGASGASNANSIIAIASSGNFATAKITSLDTNGFTLTWSKTLSPTGTATILYVAIKS